VFKSTQGCSTVCGGHVRSLSNAQTVQTPICGSAQCCGIALSRVVRRNRDAELLWPARNLATLFPPKSLVTPLLLSYVDLEIEKEYNDCIRMSKL
jgi:hypothetical protein